MSVWCVGPAAAERQCRPRLLTYLTLWCKTRNVIEKGRCEHTQQREPVGENRHERKTDVGGGTRRQEPNVLVPYHHVSVANIQY